MKEQEHVQQLCICGYPPCGWGAGGGWGAVQKVLTELRKNDGLKDRHLIVSIAAGVTLGSMQVSFLGDLFSGRRHE